MSSLQGKISVVGCGNIGGAILRGLCTSKAFGPSRVIGCDTDDEKLSALAGEFGIEATTDLAEALGKSEVVVIATKPQVVFSVAARITSSLDKSALEKLLFISVAAGVETQAVKRLLGENCRFVRAMPNLPAIIGLGVTAIFAENVRDLKQAWEIFSSVGEVVSVQSEHELNAVTGLSGSGPGFIFLLIDALTAGGISAGLSSSVARRLAAATVFGAGAMATRSEKDPAELIKQVATPGGTTLAGLEVLENSGVRAAIEQAVVAAAKRAKEINANLANKGQAVK